MSASPRIVRVAGYESCGFFKRAVSVLKSVSLLFPSRVTVIPHSFADRTTFRHWLADETVGFRLNFAKIDPRAADHIISPFVWFSRTDKPEADPADIQSFLGGHDEVFDWCREQFQTMTASSTSSSSSSTSAAGATAATTTSPVAVNDNGQVPDGHTADHNYDYDLVVIGGGSGGMAAAKEASSLGAKVACMDFVKPSPAGTKWGLGGTCVNVGCIPKKLFHAGALLHEAVQQDTPAYGVQVGAELVAAENGDKPKTVVHWDVLRESIQNHIRSLNFKYRVRLREKEVTYLNKLAKFKDAHTIEAVDKKGNVSTITASRFLIATGGRPTPLDCEGSELAISSDDIFFLEKSPGKTLCVGASYISLECAGYLAGLGHDVTIAVRSILLRGFDRECAERVGSYMEEHSGVKFKREVTPKKLEKVGEQIQVTFSDGTQDTYDTVLAAIGRTADTAKLGLENIGIMSGDDSTINPKNRRIICKNEQTVVPNVYAIGDVLDRTPELTPVAIKAGQLLARRLFGGSKEQMDYQNVCTTVFTPIEYSCVGLSEDDAIAQLGEENIEVYHKEFLPLEWSLPMSRSYSTSFTKVIVDKTQNEKVLGIHYVGPNAGEIMQGYGVAMKRGMTFKELTDTVGIHPTCSEEIVTLSATKSSGEDAAAGGC